MLALYRAGRHAEALGVYRDGHRVLREELGLEPSATLRNLELAILARDPALHAECLAPPGAPEPPAGAPKQLPPAIDDFTGRDKELAWIWQLLGKDQPRAGDGPAVVAITGLAGVGKTALAVRAAHSLRSQFPDGQLFVNLRGAELRAAEPADVLAGFLRALGVDGSSIPEGLEERAQLYRTRLADRHVLVVLDNAGDEAQVRPLLPGGTDCATLVTSRTPLVALEAAHALALQILPDEQAIELLGRLLGPVRVAAEPAASRVIVQRCGGLPLALRVVGARGAARPELRLGTLADRLADERRRLHELRVGDLEVRASLALSYASQDGDGRRAFRLLALAPAVTSAAWVAAALLDVPLNAAEEQVERLVDAALVEVAGYDAAGQIRYRMHDLLRLFARERLEDEEPAGSRSRALDRLLTACVELACYADALLQPGRRQHDPTRGGWPAHAAVVAPLEADPAAWLTAERAALVGAVRQAHAGGRWRLAWGLADGLCGFLEMRSHWDQWRQVLELALDGARRAGDGDAETQALCGLGELAYDQGNLEQAEQLLKAALERAQTHRDRRATAHALVVLSDVCRDDERLEETVVHLAEAAPIIFQLSDRRAEACALRSMALACRDLGHLEESVTCFEHCVEVFGQLGDRRWTAYARRLLAEVHRYRGDLTKATRCAELSLAELRELGDQRWVAYTLRSLADAQREQGRFADAERHYQECLEAFWQLGDRRSYAYTLRSLGELHLAAGQFQRARDHLQQAMTLFEQLGDRRGRAYALLGLGQVWHGLGLLGQACGPLERALALSRELGLSLWEARALRRLGEALAATGRREAALDLWRNALVIFQRLGLPEAAEVAQMLATDPAQVHVQRLSAGPDQVP